MRSRPMSQIFDGEEERTERRKKGHDEV